MRIKGPFLLVVALVALAAFATGGTVALSARTIAPMVGIAAPVTAIAARHVTAAGYRTLAQLIGQKLVVRMDGVSPSAGLLDRITRGEVGGVILFGANITTPAALKVLTAKLREAAAAGGQPPLLIAVDQEGGNIKRIPWAPPTVSPPAMGRSGGAAGAHAQGASTGAALRDLGINVDFAPVADVPASTASFMYKAGRTFSFSATATATLSDAFAAGLVSTGVLPTMKHFPGIGFATQNTDASVVTIAESKAALDPGLVPYRTAIGHDVPLIMLSNATYAAYDPANAAGWSHAIADTLLRGDLGFAGVTITDSLDGTAHARGVSPGSLALRAAASGTDMILLTGSEASTAAVYATLLSKAEGGSISRALLQASFDRIFALKAGL